VTSEGYGEALPLQAVAAGVAMDQHTRDTQAAASDQGVGANCASLREIRARHALYLGQLIERGPGLALDMFGDASNRELGDARRVQFARLADRVCETTRKLIVTYDRHTEEGA
jgi:hypothetical protein